MPPIFRRQTVEEQGESSRTATQPFPSGLELWFDGNEATVDMVFIHGLTGDREKTWRAPAPDGSKLEPWPKALLSKELPNTRMFSFGYDAYVVNMKDFSGKVSIKTIDDHAGELVACLGHRRAQTGTTHRPIIFVCHSLGGLVCKNALQLPPSRPEDTDVIDATRGIIFMGTPHDGSALAVYGHKIAQLVGMFRQTNKSLVQLLQERSELLENIHDRFMDIVNARVHIPGRRISLMCFFEELPLSVVGLVVERRSAIVSGFPKRGIRDDHKHMTKFSAVSDPGYRAVAEEIRWMIQGFNNANLTNSMANMAIDRRAECSASIRPDRATSALDEVEQRPVFLVPYARNDLFVGRSSILEELRTRLGSPSENLRRNTGARAAVYGLGGIGKTQIATMYAYQMRDEHPTTSIFWVHASSQERFTQSFASIANECRIPDCDPGDPNFLGRVKEWLELRARADPWTMIIDNADDISVFYDKRKTENTLQRMAQFLPSSTIGSILVTTRNKHAAVDLTGGRHILEVRELSVVDSVGIMRERLTGESYTDEELATLAEHLAYLPLALVQATSYLQRNSVSIAGYLSRLENNEQQLTSMLGSEFVDYTRDHSSEGQARNAVANTWLVSFQEIKAHNPLAVDLLNLMGCFDRNEIPLTLLEEYVEHYWWHNERIFEDEALGDEVQENCPKKRPHAKKLVSRVWEAVKWKRRTQSHQLTSGEESRQSTSGSEKCLGDPTLDDLGGAISLLVGYSFITKGQDETSFTLHRLVHLVVQMQSARSGKQLEFDNKAIFILSYEFPSGYSNTWSDSQKLMPHVRAVLGRIEHELFEPQVAERMMRLTARVALFLVARWSDWDQATRLLDLSASLYGRVPRSNSNVKENLKVLNARAFIFAQQDCHNLAIDLLEPALDDAKKRLGTSDLVIAAVTATLAGSYRHAQRGDEAVALQESALDTCIAAIGQEALLSLQMALEIASTLAQMGKALYEGLAISKWCLFNSITRADGQGLIPPCLVRMGECLAAERSDEEAAALYDTAHRKFTQVFGENHPDAFLYRSIHQMAEDWMATGLYLNQDPDSNPWYYVKVAERRDKGRQHSTRYISSSEHVARIIREYEEGRANEHDLAKDDWRKSWSWWYHLGLEGEPPIPSPNRTSDERDGGGKTSDG